MLWNINAFKREHWVWGVRLGHKGASKWVANPKSSFLAKSSLTLVNRRICGDDIPLCTRLSLRKHMFWQVLSQKRSNPTWRKKGILRPAWVDTFIDFLRPGLTNFRWERHSPARSTNRSPGCLLAPRRLAYRPAFSVFVLPDVTSHVLGWQRFFIVFFKGWLPLRKSGSGQAENPTNERLFHFRPWM